MSQLLIDRSPDLRRLRDEGYTVEVRGSHLIVHRIPYVNGSGEVAWGGLVSTLHLSGETVLVPDTHVVHFMGGQPCHRDGRPIQQLVHSESRNQLDQTLVVDRSFSNKPQEGYRDYYHKMSTYADIISGPAFSIDSENTAKQFIAIKSGEEDSVFHYHDTASSRAGIKSLTRNLEYNRIALIGLGGTGSYILDFVAKTPAKQIDLYDADKFYSHNAFRAPGAASLEELEAQQHKVHYLHGIYSKMRRGIVPHPYHVTADNEAELDGIDFAFVCIDAGDTKRFILGALEKRGIAYIDCGLGIEEVNGKLTGQVRTTTSIAGGSNHIWDKHAISFSDDEAGNEYGRNIQIAELNALNAVLAVIKWKKLSGFYLDLEGELHSIYPIDGNMIVNAYHAEEVEAAE
jgi:hypothetical protein